MEATQHLRMATSNPDVLRRNDVQIKAAERTLAYFEDTLRELQARKAQQDDPSRFPGAGPPQVLYISHSTTSFSLLDCLTLGPEQRL